MASINSVSLLSEAAFGCGMRLLEDPLLSHANLRKGHLATVMKGGQAAGQFKDSFIKANRALAPLGDSPAALLPSKSRFQSPALLRPRYICLSCSESCLSNERRAHTEKTGHQFCMHPLRLLSTQVNHVLINYLIRYGFKSAKRVLSGL